MHNFLSIRSWVVFIGSEAVLAGLLWMIGILSPVFLATLGFALLSLLWIWDHRPNWLPSTIVGFIRQRGLLDAPISAETCRKIADWEPIDRISAFRLGQWAAIISGYEYPSDIHDNPGLQLWRNEFFHLKRAIGDGTFALDENRRKSVTRLTLVTRDEITRFYAANNRRVAALFPEERTRVLQQS